MPRELEYMDLTERAILWEFSRANREGMPLVEDPVELEVRWEEGQFERLDPEGQEIVVDVILATTRNIKIGSLLWEGNLESLEDEAGTSLTPASDIYELITKNRAKDILGRVTRYEFGLKRFKDRLPSTI